MNPLTATWLLSIYTDCGDATNILKEMNEIAFCDFDSQDVVRNQLVKLIVNAYDNNK